MSRLHIENQEIEEEDLELVHEIKVEIAPAKKSESKQKKLEDFLLL